MYYFNSGHIHVTEYFYSMVLLKRSEYILDHVLKIKYTSSTSSSYSNNITIWIYSKNQHNISYKIIVSADLAQKSMVLRQA